MFRRISRELALIRESIDGVAEGLRKASDALRAAPGTSADHERLSALEGRIEVVIGTVDAALIKSESLKATARSAEDRARGHLNRAEKTLELAKGIEGGEERDPFEEGAGSYRIVPAGDDETGEGVPPVPDGVEGRRPTLAEVRARKRA